MFTPEKGYREIEVDCILDKSDSGKSYLVEYAGITPYLSMKWHVEANIFHIPKWFLKKLEIAA